MIVVFSGTTEGRRLSSRLAAEGAAVTVCVATGYGAAEQGAAPGLTVHTGRMEAGEMAALLAGAALCVDATHPYARQASENIRAACRRAGVPCLRLLRPASPLPPGALAAPDAPAAARLLEGTEGGVLLTTGTKELPAFVGLGGARLYPRVLPTHEALDACAAAGIPARNIIAMQGPFTQALNEALLYQYGARWFVTKDGGAPGGFAEKAAAARAAGAQLVVIRRPEAEADGVSYEQALEACRKAVQRCRTDPGSP